MNAVGGLGLCSSLLLSGRPGRRRNDPCRDVRQRLAPTATGRRVAAVKRWWSPAPLGSGGWLLSDTIQSKVVPGQYSTLYYLLEYRCGVSRPRQKRVTVGPADSPRARRLREGAPTGRCFPVALVAFWPSAHLASQAAAT